MKKQNIAIPENKRKPKILMLTSSYPIEGSNLGPFVQNIVKALVKKGYKIGVMIFSTTKKYKEYQKDGATIYEYPYTKMFEPMLHKNKGLIPSIKASNIAKFELIGYLFSTIKYLKKISKNYDIIHAHWYLPSGFIACMIKRYINKPIITTAWGAEFHIPNNIATRKILNFVNKKSDKKTAVSQYMKDQALKYKINVNEISVIPNFIDIKQFSLERKKINKKIIIGTVRRLVPEKRIQDLILATSQLPDKIKNNLELWIIGDGPERKRLEEYSQKTKIKNITKFFGMVDHKKIPELLSQMDIYVNPSIQEGMATANIEAMAAGCCVIATNGCGNDEILKNNIEGFLYEPKNTKDLTKKIEKLIITTGLIKKISNAGKKRAKEFDGDKIILRYENLYREMRI